jgi:hypothetical protein
MYCPVFAAAVVTANKGLEQIEKVKEIVAVMNGH